VLRNEKNIRLLEHAFMLTCPWTWVMSMCPWACSHVGMSLSTVVLTCPWACNHI